MDHTSAVKASNLFNTIFRGNIFHLLSHICNGTVLRCGELTWKCSMSPMLWTFLSVLSFCRSTKRRRKAWCISSRSSSLGKMWSTRSGERPTSRIKPGTKIWQGKRTWWTSIDHQSINQSTTIRSLWLSPYPRIYSFSDTSRVKILTHGKLNLLCTICRL